MLCFGMQEDCGDVAQMGERSVRNAEARGSIPLISTTMISSIGADS